MSELILNTPAARAWLEKLSVTYGKNKIFYLYLPGVLWTNKPGVDGEPIGGDDPSEILKDINKNTWPLLDNHDPGKLLGRVLAAKLFENTDGVCFIAGYIGIYNEKATLRLSDFGIDLTERAMSPTTAPEPHASWHIQLLHDPREIESAWIERIAQETPLPVQIDHLSHNANDQVIELLRVGLPWAVLVWNPFVTEISKEAAKDVYKTIRCWLASLIEKIQERRHPVVSLQSYVGPCEVSFLFRGADIKRNHSAREALPQAAAKAEKVINTMLSRGVSPASAVYEFDMESGWYPSFITLADGRIVSDRNILFAFESSRHGLSLGISVSQNKDKPRRG